LANIDNQEGRASKEPVHRSTPKLLGRGPLLFLGKGKGWKAMMDFPRNRMGWSRVIARKMRSSNATESGAERERSPRRSCTASTAAESTLPYFGDVKGLPETSMVVDASLLGRERSPSSAISGLLEPFRIRPAVEEVGDNNGAHSQPPDKIGINGKHFGLLSSSRTISGGYAPVHAVSLLFGRCGRWSDGAPQGAKLHIKATGQMSGNCNSGHPT